MREPMHARLRSAIFALVLATGMFGNVAALAQEYPARDVGGWTVAAGKDKRGCFLTREYQRPGRTTLLLGLDIDGSNHLSVLNDNWSIKPKDRLKLNFRLSSGGYADQVVIGMAADGKKGFVTTFEEKFPAFFAASKSLYIFRGDVPVEKLSLEESGAAVAALRQCVSILGSKIDTEAAETARSDNIPADPFARRPKR